MVFFGFPWFLELLEVVLELLEIVLSPSLSYLNVFLVSAVGVQPLLLQKNGSFQLARRATALRPCQEAPKELLRSSLIRTL